MFDVCISSYYYVDIMYFELLSKFVSGLLCLLIALFADGGNENERWQTKEISNSAIVQITPVPQYLE